MKFTYLSFGVFFLLSGIACKKFILDSKSLGQKDAPLLESPITGYEFAWSDEFDGDSLDVVRWKYRTGANYESYQRPENVRLDSGKLVIDLKQENHMGKSYTGGGVITNAPSSYGYYEVSVKMDGGYGWHEAFWTAWMSGGEDTNPAYNFMGQFEIDCFEHYGAYDESQFTYGSIVWQPHQGSLNRDYHTLTSGDLTTSFNTFGFEYTPDYLNYFFNGTLLKTVDVRGIPQHDFYLWLTCIATLPNATASGEVLFDYIRAYEISPSEYETRKVPFLAYLDSLRGPQSSSGTDLWVEAEDFELKNNWTIERNNGTDVVLRGFLSYDGGRDSAALRARTSIGVNTAGTYHLWVRSRDYASAPGTRKFKVSINGAEASDDFGDHEVNGFAWQYGGTFSLGVGQTVLDIYDSSQFYARCDKLLLTTDASFTPVLVGGASNVTHSDAFMGHGAFQVGNIAVVRIGSGSGSLVLGNAHPVFLDEYTETGTFVRSVPMPTAATAQNARLTLSAAAADPMEGLLSLSPDGKYLALAGYDAAPGYSNVIGASSAAVNRVVAVVDKNAVVNTATRLNTFNAVSVRSAVTTNGYDIWTTGGGNGVRYTTLGSTTSHAITAVTGRSLAVFDGQLYATSTATDFRVVKVGTGLPKTVSDVMTQLPGVPTTGSPHEFHFADMSGAIPGVDVLYVAYDAGYVTKFSLKSGVWVSNGSIGASGDGYRGLTGRPDGTGVRLFATRKNASVTSGGGEIVSFVDINGYDQPISGTPVVIATAPSNTIFRGIANVPEL